jgi:hypothetical protein
LVAVADTREIDETDAVQAVGIEARHLMPSHPRRSAARAGTRAVAVASLA